MFPKLPLRPCSSPRSSTWVNPLWHLARENGKKELPRNKSVHVFLCVCARERVSTCARMCLLVSLTDLQSEIHKRFFHTQPDAGLPSSCGVLWHRNTNRNNLSPPIMTLLMRSVTVNQMVKATFNMTLTQFWCSRPRQCNNWFILHFNIDFKEKSALIMTIGNVSRCTHVFFYVMLTKWSGEIDSNKYCETQSNPHTFRLFLFGHWKHTLLNPSRELFTHSFIHSFLTMWLWSVVHGYEIKPCRGHNR